MERRKYLATISSTVGALALAGCSSDSDNSEDDGGNGSTPTASPTPTSTPNPASQLNINSLIGSDDQTGNWVVRIEAENPTDQSVTADFSASFTIADNRGEFTTESSEESIPSGESQTFQLVLVDETEGNHETLTGLAFHGGLLQIFVNGEPQPEACSNSELTRPTSKGCEYQYGLVQTHVQIEYSGDGNWEGALSTGGNTRSISRSSISWPAPTGEDISYIPISDANIVSVNAQKPAANSETLTVRIVHQGEIVAEQSTSADYGVAQVSENI